jgi:hypothetical protein
MYRDKSDPRMWDTERAMVIYIQLLNTLHFASITGYRPPGAPITEEEYRAEGLPWFKIYDEYIPAANTEAGHRAFKGIHTLHEQASAKFDGVTLGTVPATSIRRITFSQ